MQVREMQANEYSLRAHFFPSRDLSEGATRLLTLLNKRAF